MANVCAVAVAVAPFATNGWWGTRRWPGGLRNQIAVIWCTPVALHINDKDNYVFNLRFAFDLLVKAFWIYLYLFSACSLMLCNYWSWMNLFLLFFISSFAPFRLHRLNGTKRRHLTVSFSYGLWKKIENDGLLFTYWILIIGRGWMTFGGLRTCTHARGERIMLWLWAAATTI